MARRWSLPPAAGAQCGWPGALVGQRTGPAAGGSMFFCLCGRRFCAIETVSSAFGLTIYTLAHTVEYIIKHGVMHDQKLSGVSFAAR